MPWMTWLGSWSYGLVFAAAAAEAALFVGLIFPGETVLLLAGFLAWRGVLTLPTTILAAALGAVVGDSIGYEIGRRYGDQVEHSWLGRRIGAARWTKADRYLEAHGGRAVFLSRFVAVAKTVTPALAGRAGIAYLRFLGWNVLGACVWATLHVGIGFLAGPSYEAVDRVVGVVGWIVVLVALAAVGGSWWWRRHHQGRPGVT